MERVVSAKLGVALAGVLTLAGCGGTAGFEPAGPTVGTKLRDLVAFNSLNLGPVAKKKPEEVELDCPPIEVLDGTASARTYAGGDQSNAGVKYQFSMGDIERECSKVGDQLVLKVGVEGRALVGPVGGPGSFTAPVRIAVRNDTDRRVVTSKFYSVPVTIQPGESQAGFAVVSDPITVPFLQSKADNDYTIVVGFDTKGQAPVPDAAARRARPRKG